MFINMNLGEGVQEAKPVPAGRYDLTIATAEHVKKKEGGKSDNIRVSIGIDGHDDAPNITHFISLPAPGEDQQKTKFKLLMAKRFLKQFNIPYDPATGFNVEDFPGATANCQVTLSEPDEETNAVYNRLNLDRLSTEQEQKAA